MGTAKVLFWGLLIGAGVVAGVYISTGELPTNGDAKKLLDDPSSESVDGEYLTRIELRADGVYAVTDVSGFSSELDLRVTLPSGETYEMDREIADTADESHVYSYEQTGLPAGNYTVSRIGTDFSDYSEEVEESHTVFLEPPPDD